MPKTKRDLREERRYALNAWLIEQDMRMDEAPFWNATQAAAEQAAFESLDAAYEGNKSDLGDELKALASQDWLDWCADIGWTPVGATQEEQADDYLDRA